MTISVLLDPTQMPNQTQPQATFDLNMANFLANLPSFGSQANALAANLNSIAAGGAYAIPYTFSGSFVKTGTGGYWISPGNGYLYFDDTDSRGGQTATVLASIFSSTSSSKAYVRVCAQNDPSRWIIYSANTSYVHGGASPNSGAVGAVYLDSAGNLVEGESVLVFIDRVGDKGDAGSLTNVMHVRDQKASGTLGGSSVSGTQTRTLNTTVLNTISGASLSGNQVTLPAGTYRFNAVAMAYGSVGGHQLSLYSITGSAVLVYGNTMYHSSTAAMDGAALISKAQVTLAATTVIELRHWISAAVTSSGLGYPSGSPQGEVFAEMFIEKVS